MVGEEFRISTPASKYDELEYVSEILKHNEWANCSSFALNTFGKGFFITERSTPLPILEHSDIFKKLHPEPTIVENSRTIAHAGDIVVQFQQNDAGELQGAYKHTMMVHSHNTPLSESTFSEKESLSAKPRISSVDYRKINNSFVQLYRPIIPGNAASFEGVATESRASVLMNKLFNIVKFW